MNLDEVSVEIASLDRHPQPEDLNYPHSEVFVNEYLDQVRFGFGAQHVSADPDTVVSLDGDIDCSDLPDT